MNFIQQQFYENTHSHWKSVFKKKNNCNNNIFVDIFNLSQRSDRRWRIKFSVCCESSFNDEFNNNFNNNFDNDLDNDMRSHIKLIRA